MLHQLSCSLPCISGSIMFVWCKNVYAVLLNWNHLNMKQLLNFRPLWLAFRTVSTLFVCEWNLIFCFSPKGKSWRDWKPLNRELVVLEHRVNRQKSLCQSIKNYLLVRCVIESDKISWESSLSIQDPDCICIWKSLKLGYCIECILHFNLTDISLICWF